MQSINRAQADVRAGLSPIPSVGLSVRKEYCGKTADWIHIRCRLWCWFKYTVCKASSVLELCPMSPPPRCDQPGDLRGGPQPVHMPFGVVSGVCRGKGVLGEGGDRRSARGNLGVNVGHPLVTYGNFMA